MNAYDPRVRHTVLLSSAPQARMGRASNGKSTGNGAYPRERRIGSSPPAAKRVTESSQRTWIGRSWSRKASAIPPSLASASPSSVAMGSSLLFPLVITSVFRHGAGAPKSRWWSGEYGSITPSQPSPGATDSATPESGRARMSNDGPGRRSEERAFVIREVTQTRSASATFGRHQSEWLGLAPLPFPEPAHRRLVRWHRRPGGSRRCP